MSLFDGYKLPDDERALEILQRISDLWEDNACVTSMCSGLNPSPRIYHQRVSVELRELLIRLSVSSSQALEDMLDEETSLHNILLFANDVMRDEYYYA